MKEREMFTLHEDFGLAHDFLEEAIDSMYSEKKLMKAIDKILSGFTVKKVEVTEEEIDESIEIALSHLEGAYRRTDHISKEQYEEYLITYSNRDDARKELEIEGPSFTESAAIAEYIAALLGKGTTSFQRFLDLNSHIHALEKKFQKLQKKYNRVVLQELIPKILTIVIEELKKEEIIDDMGIYGEENIKEWKESIYELEENLRSCLKL